MNLCPDRLPICGDVSGFQIMMSSASLQGNISPSIHQRRLRRVRPVMLRLPLQPGCEDCLSRDGEAPGEKWRSICFPSCYLHGRIWLTHPCRVTHDVFFSHFKGALLRHMKPLTYWVSDNVLCSHLAASPLVGHETWFSPNSPKPFWHHYFLCTFML